jgi:hypothetical protein
MLKHRVHATLISFGKPCPVTDLFGVAGRTMLTGLQMPEPWRSTLLASVRAIDHLEEQIDSCNKQLRAMRPDHKYVPTLLTTPGIGWVLAFTIAAEIGEIERFDSADKLVGYTGLCPRVIQSGDSDRRGPLTKTGPKFLRWAMLEATMHALRHAAYSERYQRTKRRLGKQRGPPADSQPLARAHLRPTLPPTDRCRRRRSSSGRLDGPFGLAPTQPTSHTAWSSHREGDRDMSVAPTRLGLAAGTTTNAYDSASTFIETKDGSREWAIAADVHRPGGR